MWLKSMIYSCSEKHVKEAALCLKRGGLVAFPTETVYGLGGNALDPGAVARIFEAKGRPEFDPLITHIADLGMIDILAEVQDSRVYELARYFWPGPLTLIVPKKNCVPDLVTSGLPAMALRMPDHPVALALIREASGAVAAPSANSFGYLSPTTARHVEEDLGPRIDMILDGGPCRVGLESTVLDMTGTVPEILRPGAVSLQNLEEVLGAVKVLNRREEIPRAPGQLKMHYSPRKALYICDDLNSVEDKAHSGALVFSNSEKGRGFGAMEVLSEQGDMLVAAARLFAALHRLDISPVVRIHAERIPEKGLGRAIMDRIYKASEK